MRLIFVHGRDQEGKDCQALQRIWQAALDAGLDAAGLPAIGAHEVAFPYYADALASMVAEIRSRPLGQFRTKGEESQSNPLDAFEAELLREILGESAIPAGLGRPIEKGLQNTALARALGRAADISWFGPGVLTAMTQDVSVYLNNPVVAKRVEDFVVPAIGSEPCVVVAHSLGSVVAYRVLRQLGASAKVRLLVTVGSPLGLATICKKLSPPARAFPAGVTSWLNAYDTADIVSLHPLDKTTWPVSPAIANISTVKNHMGNRHGISGYLDDPHVARAVYEALNVS
jgi:hypothetical protein